jgi:23S rRNA pseudouridine2605 synthase
MADERIQRALARAGFGSRRACEQLIVEGRVTVNGNAVTLGDRTDTEHDEVRVDGLKVNLDPTVKYYALHKPAGVVTSMSDPQGRADIRDLLPTDAPRVFPVGRLDRDTEGLLLLTNDGDLANRLSHPSFGIEKEYLAELDGQPSARQLARVRTGVDLEDGPARAAAVRIVAAARGRAAVRIVMTEGRKREVRRLLAAVGLPVTRLVRLRVGPVRLGTLPAGEVRPLTHEEVIDLARAIGR